MSTTRKELYSTLNGTAAAASVTPRAASAIRADQHFRASQRIARIGSWEWNAIDDRHWWSDELYRLLDIEPSKGSAPIDQLVERIHPHDRAAFVARKEELDRTGDAGSFQIRIRAKDGAYRIYHCQGETELDANGRLLCTRGTLQDVTERYEIELRLRESEKRYRDAQRIARLGNWEWNVRTNEQWWSDELFRILELDPATTEASFERFIERVHPEDRAELLDGKERMAIDGPDTESRDIRLRIGDRERIVEMLVEVHADYEGRPSVVIGTVRDVTESRMLKARLKESELRYLSTVEIAAVGIAHVAPSGQFLWANPHLLAMLGYSEEELLASTIRDVSHPEDADRTTEERARLHAREFECFKTEKRYVRKDGRVIWVRITTVARFAEDGSPLYDVSVVEDVSDRKAAEERVNYLAAHDELTGLANRTIFTELLDHALRGAERHQRQLAVLFIDLDRFKIINDSLGHFAGDELLRSMAGRIRKCLRKSDIVARLGGDEFVVLLDEPGDRDMAARIAKKILSAVMAPVEIQGRECRVTASIGIAAYPGDAADALVLMKQADMAMYVAKDNGKNNFQFYSPESSPMSVERLTIESNLARALERNELAVHYQAKVDSGTGTIRGAEALLRWWSAELGTVLPSQFIPVAEDSGLIVPIGKWVLKTACEQNVRWQRDGLPRVVMSVNLSPRQFQDESLLDDVAAVLAETNMSPELLELEITESMIMHNVDKAAAKIAAIKNLGVRLAIDDFGTGYSSLSQLKRFPIDTLKIDRSFVRDVPDNAEDKAITEAIISLGKTLGVRLVAEGVETFEQHRFLSERHCDEMQGYYFSKPCSAGAFARLLGEVRLAPASARKPDGEH